MLKVIISLICIFAFRNLEAQNGFDQFIDSSIGKINFSKNDWAIGLTSETAGEIYDSLGNSRMDPNLNSTIFIIKSENKFYLQIFSKTCWNNDSCYPTFQRILLKKSAFSNYTVDTIRKAVNEYIYPYIYKSNGVDGYNFQSNGDHSTFFKMNFKTQKLDFSIPFEEISFIRSMRFLKSSETNLNFHSNTKTFTYRAFLEFEFILKTYK
jgi:hypothetical protein